MKQPTVERMFVTPKMAAEFLKLNTNNRKLSKTKVTQYGCVMLDNQWKADGSAIMISTEGVLMNGQHRLNALIESGIKGIWFVIMRNVPPDAMLTIDCGGKPRSVGENLELMGVADGREKAPAVNAILKLITKKNATTHAEVESGVERFAKGIDWVISAAGLHKPGFSAARVRGPFAMAYIVAPRLVEEIAERAQSGVGCTEGDAALAIRNVVMGVIGHKKGTSDSRHVGEKVLYALMKAIEGRPVILPKAGSVPVEFFVERLETVEKVAPKVRSRAA